MPLLVTRVSVVNVPASMAVSSCGHTAQPPRTLIHHTVGFFTLSGRMQSQFSWSVPSACISIRTDTVTAATAQEGMPRHIRPRTHPRMHSRLPLHRGIRTHVRSTHIQGCSWCSAQAPLQPLADNLDNSVYETFERDRPKYEFYQEALRQALHDLQYHAESSAAPPASPQGLVVAVLGAGRGPLVEAALLAADAVGASVMVIAIEKNPSAVAVLRGRLAEARWRGRVALVPVDMREMTVDRQADIMVRSPPTSFVLFLPLTPCSLIAARNCAHHLWRVCCGNRGLGVRGGRRIDPRHHETPVAWLVLCGPWHASASATLQVPPRPSSPSLRRCRSAWSSSPQELRVRTEACVWREQPGSNITARRCSLSSAARGSAGRRASGTAYCGDDVVGVPQARETSRMYPIMRHTAAMDDVSCW